MRNEVLGERRGEDRTGRESEAGRREGKGGRLFTSCMTRSHWKREVAAGPDSMATWGWSSAVRGGEIQFKQEQQEQERE
eukprot:204017-Hanusia_phi.AAC.1